MAHSHSPSFGTFGCVHTLPTIRKIRSFVWNALRRKNGADRSTASVLTSIAIIINALRPVKYLRSFHHNHTTTLLMDGILTFSAPILHFRVARVITDSNQYERKEPKIAIFRRDHRTIYRMRLHRRVVLLCHLSFFFFFEKSAVALCRRFFNAYALLQFCYLLLLHTRKIECSSFVFTAIDDNRNRGGETECKHKRNETTCMQRVHDSNSATQTDTNTFAMHHTHTHIHALSCRINISAHRMASFSRSLTVGAAESRSPKCLHAHDVYLLCWWISWWWAADRMSCRQTKYRIAYRTLLHSEVIYFLFALFLFSSIRTCEIHHIP